MDIIREKMGALFSRYVNWRRWRKNKQLISRERIMPVVVEGLRPYLWSCGEVGLMRKVCPGKNVALRSSQAEQQKQW